MSRPDAYHLDASWTKNTITCNQTPRVALYASLQYHLVWRICLITRDAQLPWASVPISRATSALVQKIRNPRLPSTASLLSLLYSWYSSSIVLRLRQKEEQPSKFPFLSTPDHILRQPIIEARTLATCPIDKCFLPEKTHIFLSESRWLDHIA